MSQNLIRKLKFFRDCLEAENRSRTIWSFPTSKSMHVQAMPGIANRLDTSVTYYQKLEKTLNYYDREKYLVFNALFLNGRFKVPSFAGSTRTRDIKCPLFICSSTLSDSGRSRYAVNVDLEQASINPAAIQILEHFGLNVVDHIVNLLRGYQRVDDSQHQTNLVNQLSKDLATASIGQMSLLAECYLSVENKQSSAQGSLYEMESLAEARYLSLPLKTILKESEPLKPSFWRWLRPYWPFKSSEVPLPEVLSDAQENILDAAGKYPLTVVSGPPGTGKSFTIACLALREFSLGNSVLVVSQNQHAVDVVRRKLIDQMGIDPNLTVLGSDQGVSPEVKVQINRMLTMRNSLLNDDAAKIKRQLKKLTLERRLLEKRFNEKINSLTSSELTTSKGTSNNLWVSSFWRFSRAERTTSKALLFDQFAYLESIDEKIKALVEQFMSAHYKETAITLASKPKSRLSLESFAKSLTARNQHYQEKYYQDVDFKHVLKAVPFWFSSVSNLHRLLPMQEALFDLVVIDEATQCNMAVCLPALQRAKRVVILGDPKQLKHVSFVSYEQQQHLANLHKLDRTEISDNFRAKSILDYAQSACELAEQSTLLNEHFRSHPQIIQFSNNEFYQRRLKVMTERPSNRQRSIEVNRVDGRRLSKGVNKQEAEAVLSRVKKIILEQRQLPELEVHTLGILSFFSAQSSHIEKLVFNQISLNDMRRHNIRVGTPFSFQGEERDHMLISCSVDAQTPGNAYTYLNRDDVFNVSITRARDFQSLFLSCDFNELKSGSKLKSYLKYIDEYEYREKSNSGLSSDSFQDEIANWLSKRGVDVYKNYSVAGISIDIMAVFHGHSVAIDLIGFKGDLKESLSLTQFKLLQRAGLESFLLPYKEWQEQTEAVLHALMLRLGKAHELADIGAHIDKFTDQQEDAFKQLSKGLSINKLSARLLRNDEVDAVEQLNGLISRYSGFVALLNRNFTPNELTYRRYLNALNELTQFCLSNLQKASVASELANSMLEQQKLMYGDKKYNDEFDDVISARLSMVDEQRAKLKSFVAKNGKALLQIDKTMLKLANLSDDDLIDPIEALKELSDRLDLYRGKTLNQE